MRERDIERILVEQVQKQGGRAYKWISPGNDGVPDRIVILPDTKPIFVELKSEAGRLRPLQEMQIKRLQKLGQWVEIIKGIDGLALFFKELGYPDVSSWIATRYGGR